MNEPISPKSQTFMVITQDPTSPTHHLLHMHCLERFTLPVYSQMCSANSVNEARKMFTNGLKARTCIPPTQHALRQHKISTLLVAAFI
jgi:hypothetical protein